MAGVAGLIWGIIVVLVIAWLVLWLAVHVASWAIHILIVAAIILVIWNLLTRQRAV